MVFFTLNVNGQPLESPMNCGTEGSSTPAPESPAQGAICTDPDEIRYLPLALHFILLEESEEKTVEDCGGEPDPSFTIYYAGNFTEIDDGIGNTNYNGFQRAEDIIDLCNYELANNQSHWRKTPGEYYPDPPPSNNIRYLLAGVYFHRDNTFWNSPAANYFSKHAIYGVGGNQIIDVYLAPNDPTGRASGHGPIDKFTHIQNYDRYIQPSCRDWSLEFAANNLNHEIGHLLNLYHTWSGGDGCPDTPEGFIYDNIHNSPLSCGGATCCTKKANCWNYNPSIDGCPEKPCDDWSKISNNIMDYNEYFPSAYTLQQINRINTHLATDHGNSYIHSCGTCMPSMAFFHIGTISICGNPIPSYFYFNGEASFNETSYNFSICEVSGTGQTNCIGTNSYQSGWISGEVGKINLAQLYSFEVGKYYYIKLDVDNACQVEDSHEEWVLIPQNCYAELEPCEQCYTMQTVNPFNQILQIEYTLTQPGYLTWYIVHSSSGYLELFTSNEYHLEGSYYREFEVGHLPSGSYQLVAVYNNYPYAQTVLKQ